MREGFFRKDRCILRAARLLGIQADLKSTLKPGFIRKTRSPEVKLIVKYLQQFPKVRKVQLQTLHVTQQLVHKIHLDR